MLAFVCVSAIIFFPIINLDIIYKGITEHAVFDAYGFHVPGSEGGYLPAYIIFTVLALLNLLGILLYKNRKKQLLVVRISFLFHLIIAASFLLFALFGKSMLIDELKNKSEGMEVSFSYGVGYYLMFISIPFILLAIRGIRADEKLVKSLDRIR